MAWRRSGTKPFLEAFMLTKTYGISCDFSVRFWLQEERQLALRKQGLGVMLDSELPHLISIDVDILSTGIMLFHIKVSCERRAMKGR